MQVWREGRPEKCGFCCPQLSIVSCLPIMCCQQYNPLSELNHLPQTAISWFVTSSVLVLWSMPILRPPVTIYSLFSCCGKRKCGCNWNDHYKLNLSHNRVSFLIRAVYREGQSCPSWLIQQYSVTFILALNNNSNQVEGEGVGSTTLTTEYSSVCLTSNFTIGRNTTLQ